MKKGHRYYLWVYENYWNCYHHYGLGHTITALNEKVRDGFLYQEPNPDYDKWLPENCTPIYFKDWLKDKIPEWLPRPKVGPKGIGIISPRPIVCVETGKLYRTYREADEDLGVYNCKESCKYERIFTGGYRFTWIDPFMEDNGRPWKGFKDYENFNPNSMYNASKPVYIEETGEHFDSVKECCEELAKRFNLSYVTANGRYKRHRQICGLTIKEDKWS